MIKNQELIVHKIGIHVSLIGIHFQQQRALPLFTIYIWAKFNDKKSFSGSGFKLSLVIFVYMTPSLYILVLQWSRRRCPCSPVCHRWRRRWKSAWRSSRPSGILCAAVELKREEIPEMKENLIGPSGHSCCWTVNRVVSAELVRIRSSLIHLNISFCILFSMFPFPICCTVLKWLQEP